jgi:hypothetical protein
VKATGPRDERETIIRWDDENDTAEIWTASDVTYRRMLKRGWFPAKDDERSAVFMVPKGQVRLPRTTKRKVTKLSGIAARKVLGVQSTKS